MDTRILLAKLFLASDQIDKAMLDASDIVDLAPNDARSHAIMAAAQLKLGELEKTGHSIERAEAVLSESLDAGNETVAALRLLTQVQVMQGKWNEAEDLVQRLRTYESEAAVSEQMLGLVYQGQQQNEKSIEAFKRAHDLDPEVPEPIMAVVQAYVRGNPGREPGRRRVRQFQTNYLVE